MFSYKPEAWIELKGRITNGAQTVSLAEINVLIISQPNALHLCSEISLFSNRYTVNPILVSARRMDTYTVATAGEVLRDVPPGSHPATSDHPAQTSQWLHCHVTSITSVPPPMHAACPAQPLLDF